MNFDKPYHTGYVVLDMRKKLIRFRENTRLDNVLEPEINVSKKIDWKDVFGNSNPIILELGCGRGEYAIGLSRMSADKNFIGVDVKGDRIWYGATEAKQDDLKNVIFLRSSVDHLDKFFGKNSVDEIWITFPGPRFKNSEENRRLTNQIFLNLYAQILKPGGVVHVKTDSNFVYKYTSYQLAQRPDATLLKVLPDLYKISVLSDDLKIKTRFEKRFLAKGEKIKYMRFSLTKKTFSSIIRSLLGV